MTPKFVEHRAVNQNNYFFFLLLYIFLKFIFVYFSNTGLNVFVVEDKSPKMLPERTKTLPTLHCHACMKVTKPLTFVFTQVGALP